MKQESPIKVAKKALLGTVLGDSHIAINKSKTEGHIVLTHSLKQLPYLIWKLDTLVPIIGPVHISGIKKVSDKYRSVVAASRNSVYLKHIYNDFYFEREGKVKKEVHINVLNRLDPVSLAIWYQDDGGVNTKNGTVISSISLAVCSFSDNELELICKYFKDVWQLVWKIKTMSSGYKVLISSGDSMRSFIEIIYPHMCPWMNYKIDSLNSAKSLSEMEGDDMIRSFEQSKELVGNIQLFYDDFNWGYTSNDDSELTENEYAKHRVPYGIKLSEIEVQEYKLLVINSKPQWRKLVNSNGTSWYIFLHGDTDKMMQLRKVFGGYIRSYVSNAEFRIGERSAFRMCDVLGLEKMTSHRI